MAPWLQRLKDYGAKRLSEPDTKAAIINGVLVGATIAFPAQAAAIQTGAAILNTILMATPSGTVPFAH